MKAKIVLIFVLLVAAITRVWRIGQILGFYYDQGRDALVIWHLWHDHRFFLIGPTTGIEGIFRGPWYYWLIAPWYLLGRGDPVWPAVFLNLTTVLAIFLLYQLAVKISGHAAGFVAVVIASLSFYLILAGRWLSNPTPMMFISMGIIYSLFLIQDNKKWAWPLLAFLLAQSMQFGSSTEIFYFPAILILLLFYRRWPDFKTLLFSVSLFAAVFLPQVLFDVRHQFIMTHNVLNFLFAGQSFKASFSDTLHTRMAFYYQMFSLKLFPNDNSLAKYFFAAAAVSVLLNIRNLSSRFWQVLLIFVTPLVGMLFFHGNQGNVYDYYFTGYYFVFVLVFSVLLVKLFPGRSSLLPIAVFFLYFIYQNVPLDINYLSSGSDGPTTVNYENSLSAVDWVYQDARATPFNVDEYVPPVIPYVYDYLFLWRGTTRYHLLPDPNRQPLLYTIYEVDGEHPQFLAAWLKRQAGYATPSAQIIFGGITAQKRHRI